MHLSKIPTLHPHIADVMHLVATLTQPPFLRLQTLPSLFCTCSTDVLGSYADVICHKNSRGSQENVKFNLKLNSTFPFFSLLERLLAIEKVTQPSMTFLPA